MTIEEYKARKLKNINDMLKASGAPIKDIKSTRNLCNRKECKYCFGICCNSFPCSFSKMDFVELENKDYIEALLETGLLTISRTFYEITSSDSFFVLRPMSYHDRGHIVGDNFCYDHSNACRILSTTEGCLFERDFRPSGGLLLLPSKTKCFIGYPIEEQKKDWEPYQGLLYSLANEYGEKTISNWESPATKEAVKAFQKLLIGVK